MNFEGGRRKGKGTFSVWVNPTPGLKGVRWFRHERGRIPFSDAVPAVFAVLAMLAASPLLSSLMLQETREGGGRRREIGRERKVEGGSGSLALDEIFMTMLNKKN